MPRFLIVLLLTVLGFAVAAVVSYFLVTWLSSNPHDRALEAAMSAVFVYGPLGAAVSGITAFIVLRKK